MTGETTLAWFESLNNRLIQNRGEWQYFCQLTERQQKGLTDPNEYKKFLRFLFESNEHLQWSDDKKRLRVLAPLEEAPEETSEVKITYSFPDARQRLALQLQKPTERKEREEIPKEPKIIELDADTKLMYDLHSHQFTRRNIIKNLTNKAHLTQLKQVETENMQKYLDQRLEELELEESFHEGMGQESNEKKCTTIETTSTGTGGTETEEIKMESDSKGTRDEDKDEPRLILSEQLEEPLTINVPVEITPLMIEKIVLKLDEHDRKRLLVWNRSLLAALAHLNLKLTKIEYYE